MRLFIEGRSKSERLIGIANSERIPLFVKYCPAPVKKEKGGSSQVRKFKRENAGHYQNRYSFDFKPPKIKFNNRKDDERGKDGEEEKTTRFSFPALPKGNRNMKSMIEISSPIQKEPRKSFKHEKEMMEFGDTLISMGIEILTLPRQDPTNSQITLLIYSISDEQQKIIAKNCSSDKLACNKYLT